MITIFVGEGEVCSIDYNLIREDGAWEGLSGRQKLFCDLASHILQKTCQFESRAYFLKRKQPFLCAILKDFDIRRLPGGSLSDVVLLLHVTATSGALRFLPIESLRMSRMLGSIRPKIKFCFFTWKNFITYL